MKKILMLQIKGKSLAGVWHVNKLIGEELLKKDYNVHVVSIRNNQIDIEIEHDPTLVVKTINEKDLWESLHLVDIVSELKSFQVISFFQKLFSKIKHKIGLSKDVKKLHEYIYNYDPDCIITTHYQLLDMVPKKYLKRTIHEQHSSFADALSNKANIKTFDKYKDKIKFVWLTKSTMDKAVSCGYSNSTYIYNAVRFKSDKTADVVKNKKLITITRLSKDKSIDKMIEIVEKVFQDKKYKDWSLEIYGNGSDEEYLKGLVTNKKQIKFMGITYDPKKELLSASINLNTSKYEGFSLSILEANECGVPTIAFNFGESANEQILNNKTGIVASNFDDYVEQLKGIMDDKNKLQELSNNAKEYSEKFQIENIIEEWGNLFEEVEHCKK